MAGKLAGKPSKSHRESIQSILETAKKIQNDIIYGQKTDTGEITLAEAVLNELKIKKSQYDVGRKKLEVVDETVEMIERACKKLIIDAENRKKAGKYAF